MVMISAMAPTSLIIVMEKARGKKNKNKNKNKTKQNSPWTLESAHDAD